MKIIFFLLSSLLFLGCASTSEPTNRLYEASVLEEESFKSKNLELGLIGQNVVLWTGNNSDFVLKNLSIVKEDASCLLTLSNPRQYSENQMISLFTLNEASQCISGFDTAIAVGTYQGTPYGMSTARYHGFKIKYSIGNKDFDFLESIPVFFR